ncbi:MAG: DUF3343 domain-containing protein [Solirubrobacterales bacterium]
MTEKRFYILFPSYTEGMKLESLLKKNSIKYTIVPTPRRLSVCCGISIMYNEEDWEKIQVLIKENSVNIIGMESLDFEKKNYYL